MGLLTPCSVPRGGFLYTMIVPGGGFLLPSSCVPGEWFWNELIPALEGNEKLVFVAVSGCIAAVAHGNFCGEV